MAHNLFGKKVLMDNINSKDIINVDLSKQNRYLISELNKHHIPYKIRDDTFFNTFPKQLNHQGIVITIDKKQTITTIESLVEFTNLKTRSVILVIDSIQDPQNFGSILRTCDAMKVDAIIYKKNNQVQINDFVSKTSMGAIQHLNLIKVSNLNQVITTLKKTGFWSYVSTLTENSAPYTKVRFMPKTVLIVGNEEKGVSQLLTKLADFQIKIPMLGKVQSLNVSVATGIILAEINRQIS